MRHPSPSRESFDAIVVGGGPAGALSALLLARLGWSVAIIERGQRHRDKTCGHCLSPRALPILHRAGLLDRVLTLASGETGSLRVHASACAALQVPVDRGVVVARSSFDQQILDAAAEAGVVVMQPASARVRDAHRSHTNVTVQSHAVPRDFTTRLVIGADGLGSRVARAFRVQPTRPGHKFGFSFDVSVSCAASDSIDMFVISGGYIGLVRQRNAVHFAGLIDSIGRIAPRKPMTFCRAVASEFDELTWLRDCIGAEVTPFAATGPMPWRPSPARIAGDRYALVGDAAGYVEPFTGEGMSWALQGAEALAEVASGARPGYWNERLADRYKALWRERVAHGHDRCARIAWALERPWAMRAAHLLARSAPAMANRMARQVAAA